MRLLAFAFDLMVALIVLSQLVIPLLTGRSVFPMFRKQKREIDSNIVDVHDDIDNLHKQKELKELQEQRDALATEVVPKEDPTQPKPNEPTDGGQQ